MNDPKKPADAPGHDAAGNGEQSAEGAVITELVIDVEAPGEDAPSNVDDCGTPAVFRPADIHVRPPDRPPTEGAPASEKAGLIFERS